MAMDERHGNQSCRCMEVVVPRQSNQQANVAIKGVVVIIHDLGKSGPGKSASLQIYSRTQLDLDTGKGKLSEKAKLQKWKSKKKSDGSRSTFYKIKLKVENGFGIPGAFVITNQHKHKFFLKSAFLQTHNNPESSHFYCNSWIYPINLTATQHLFFSNTSYIPSQTPRPLMELRKEELKKLRGDGEGERKEWERIYDYDCYDYEHSGPVLNGSSSLPYPRRGRTVQSLNADGSIEKMNSETCVPPDERMRHSKVIELATNSVQAALQFLIPTLKTLNHQPYTIDHFKSFVELHHFFWAQKPSNLAQADQWTKQKFQKFLPKQLFQQILSQKDHFMYPLPQLLTENESGWMDDDEFARQMLAGTNPVRITCLHKFPPESKTKVVSTIKASDIEHRLDDLTLQQDDKRRVKLQNRKMRIE